MNKIFRVGIFSGKGGVGKTTICASLAVLLAEKGYNIVIVDTDVDAPNLSILFNPNNQKQNEIFVKTTEKAFLKETLCTHCKCCIDERFCNFNALLWDPDQKIPKIDSISCEGCRACKLLCHYNAFEIQQVDSGKIAIIESSYNFPVITGETILGAQTSGKLVTELKRFAEKVAIEKNVQLILYDGPPGIGCPVIASASGLDYIIIVIEPTEASLHDSKRFIEITNKFQIPFGIIINKSNISKEGNQKIHEYIESNHLEYLGEIPLDKDWPFSIAKRQPFVKYRPDSPTTQIFYQIIDQLVKNIGNYVID